MKIMVASELLQIPPKTMANVENVIAQMLHDSIYGICLFHTWSIWVVEQHFVAGSLDFCVALPSDSASGSYGEPSLGIGLRKKNTGNPYIYW